MTAPSWVQDAVFYQIFPDRFCNGDPANDPPDVQPWRAEPTRAGFKGGDLVGVRSRLDYLRSLGVSALYLNPIFQAASNHRYDTTDYRLIDDRVGSLRDFRDLVKAAHARGMRVIIDGVFNHSGRGFGAFRDVLDRGPGSRYRGWYHIHRFPLDAFGRGRAHNYEAWWGIRSLPKLNTDHPDVRRYLLETAAMWIAEGADGWRFDVPNEIADESFWADVRATVKAINPEAYLLGEIWTVNPAWVGPTAFDGLMNYPLRKSLIDLVIGGHPPSQFRADVEHQVSSYPAEHLRSHYNLVGSHDTPRVATLARGHRGRLKVLFALQFCLPGAPAIYYGDEIGMRGGKDPDCRRGFEWDEARWDSARSDLLKALVRLRSARAELRRGDVRFLHVDDRAGTLVLVRTLPGAASLLAVNLSSTPRVLDLDVTPLGWTGRRGLTEGLSGTRRATEGGILHLDLPPHDCRVVHDDGPATSGDV
jgi:cyclomaltodextrinase